MEVGSRRNNARATGLTLGSGCGWWDWPRVLALVHQLGIEELRNLGMSVAVAAECGFERTVRITDERGPGLTNTRIVLQGFVSKRPTALCTPEKPIPDCW